MFSTNTKEKSITLNFIILTICLIAVTNGHFSDHAMAYNLDFAGTVLYDSQVGSTSGAAFQQKFTGSFFLEPDGLITFNRNLGSAFYSNSPSDDFYIGELTQNENIFHYVYSRDSDNPNIRMGLVWWTSQPTSITTHSSRITDIYGVVFYLNGNNFTAGNRIANQLEDYIFQQKTFNIIQGSIPITGCSLSSGEGFLGVITSSSFATESSLPVPLPSSLLLLICGLIILCSTAHISRKMIFSSF